MMMMTIFKLFISDPSIKSLKVIFPRFPKGDISCIQYWQYQTEVESLHNNLNFLYVRPEQVTCNQFKHISQQILSSFIGHYILHFLQGKFVSAIFIKFYKVLIM